MRPTHRLLLVLALLISVSTPAFGDSAKDSFDSGNAKYTNGNFDGAIADYSQAIDLKSDYEMAYNNRGLAKRKKGDLDGAIFDFTKAIELKADYEHAYLDRGIAKRDKGDLDGAITDYNKAIELKSDDEAAYYCRGVAKRGKGDIAGAIVDWTKATEVKPDFELPYIALGMAKREKGDLDGAISVYSKAIELNPKNAISLYSSRGCLRYYTHDFTQALADFQKAIEIDPSNDYSHFHLYLTRSHLGETQAATRELQTFLASRPPAKSNDWPATLGRFLSGDLTESDLLASAKNNSPKTEVAQLCEAYFYAASKHLLTGDTTTAIQYFQKSIATNQRNFFEYTGAVAELKFLNSK